MFDNYVKRFKERKANKQEHLEKIAKRKFLMELTKPGSSEPKRTRPPIRLTNSTGPR